MTENSVALEPVERETGSKLIAAGAARSIVMRRHYDSPIEDVWAACTEPNRINRWFDDVSGDLREGGTFSLGDYFTGEVLACRPPRMYRISWPCGDRPADEVELRLEPSPSGGTVPVIVAKDSDRSVAYTSAGS
ncbi:SRPBCC domain-containing protein [Saccharopolyspora sp. NPDC000359]|uniref:SRPBCC domain-containing protein n=1 Tax=Saccharopolyspora sp. NPDC000359 TaxID=3154251 RepID=UPI003323F93F